MGIGLRPEGRHCKRWDADLARQGRVLSDGRNCHLVPSRTVGHHLLPPRLFAEGCREAFRSVFTDFAKSQNTCKSS